MLSQYRIRRPPKHFNLIYLETNQHYFMSLKVHLLIDPTHQEIDGKLHLCTRSIFFEPSNISKPLIRMKYSCGVFLRMMKNIDIKKVQKLVNMNKSQNQIKSMLTKGPNFITDLLQQDQQINKKKQQKQQNILIKLYDPLKKKKIQTQQKIINCLFIKLQKIFIIYRRPISPYITQKTQQNYIFILDKTNKKDKILRFLKLYDEISKCFDQDKLIRSIINACQQQSTQNLLQQYHQQKLQQTNIYKCRRITIEGVQYGQIILFKNRVKYIPLINCPQFENIEFTYRQIKYLIRYRYHFQDNGIQLWLYNYPYSILLVFDDKNQRENIFRHLRVSGQKIVKLEMFDIVKMWINGEISNVQYLNYLNILANRSHNDLSQYPVFPWIIHSYDIQFNLKNGQMYRNLGKPIGTINKHRLRKLKDIYQIQVKDKTLANPPHLYPTHYSTPGYVCYYLIRKIPQFIVKLQNGVFSPSDRIFRCVQSAYYSTMNSVADFKQLIPQFFSNDSDFLVNSQKLEMGSTPQGEAIDDVILPKWALNAQDYLLKMRAAFESDYVSSHLNQWIDLIFGQKQTGTSAITSDNVYYYLTYQQNVNFDKPMSRMQKTALQVQISQFGQVPLQLFQQRHPLKKARILNLDIIQTNQDKKIISAKLIALGQQNQKLRQQLQRQRFRFNKKINQKQQILIKNQKDKKKQIDKIKQLLEIDTYSLKNFKFKDKFDSQAQRNIYVRQLEQLLKIKDRQNQEMNVIITGMKRQINVDAQLQENIDNDFLDVVEF